MSSADDLHQELFGFTPRKPGTAYERLAAVVLAAQGWEDVRHDTRLRPNGRRTTHQLDITATHPDGSVRRLLVECKDWNKDVGKGTMDALVGVRNQAGFDAAMAVTTKGFTSGAVDVAVDEDLAMVILREVRPDDHFVMGFRIEIVPVGHDWSNVQFLVAEENDPGGGRPHFMSTDDHLLNPDGTTAERLLDVLHSQGGGGWDPGTFDREIRFEGGRIAPTSDGGQLSIVGMKWTETISASSPMISEKNETGQPCLVVERIDDKGEAQDGRLFVDRHLNVWDIDPTGEVVPRGRFSDPEAELG
jgi:Restriction endonuclease